MLIFSGAFFLLHVQYTVVLRVPGGAEPTDCDHSLVQPTRVLEYLNMNTVQVENNTF